MRRIRSGLGGLLAVLLWMGPSAGGARASTEGTEFWACHLENRDNALVTPFGIVVANGGAVAANVLIEVSTGPLGSGVVPPGTTRAFTFPPTRQVFETSLQPHAYRVTSDVPVSVVQFNPLDDPALVPSYTADASTLLPARALGSSYRVMSWPEQLSPSGAALRGLIGIIGVADEPTTVTVTPMGDTLDGFIRATPAGTPVTFTLRRFDVAQIQTEGTRQDLTGSLVVSDHPVAVFGGATCVRVPDESGYCDHLEEQIFPTSAWGRDFVLVKSEPRAGEPDWYRVLASENGTTIFTDPDVAGGTTNVDAGGFIEFSTDMSFELHSTAPVLVGQYFVGREHDPTATIGDPSLMLAVPVEQFDDDQVVLTPESYDADYLTLIRRAGRDVRLDGALVPDASFTAVASSGYEAARVFVRPGPHRVSSTGGVGVQCYGFGEDVSYAYFGGTNVDPIHSLVACDPGGPYLGGCGAGPLLLDGSRSSGPGALTYQWTALTPGVTFADATSAVTEAVVPGPGPAQVMLTVRWDAFSSTCVAELPAPAVSPPAPAELSQGPPAEWLRVRKDPSGAPRLILSFEDRTGAGESVNLYAGTILRTGIVAYDHAPLSCAFLPAPSAPGIGEIAIDAIPGMDRYFLISASNCSAESGRGRRSDGVPRPDLPTDCGPS